MDCGWRSVWSSNKHHHNQHHTPSLQPSPTRLSSPKGRSNVSLHCRQACHRTLVGPVQLWQLLWEWLCQLSLPKWTPAAQCQACGEITRGADVGVAIAVDMAAVARWMTPGSASSATCQITSSETASNRLSPTRLQKGTPSGYHLSPARLPGASPRGL